MADLLEPIAPATKFAVPPTNVLQNSFDTAAANGDIAGAKRVMTLANGTTLAPEIQNSIKFMEKQVTPVIDIKQKADANGGVGTPTGNIAAADAIKDWSKTQPETGFLKGLSASFMGVPDSWKLMTQGQVAPQQEYDKYGNGATVFYAQNNPKSPLYAISSDNKVISPKEYQDRGFGLFKDASSSPFVQASGSVYKKNAEAFQQTAARTNLSTAAYSDVAANAQKINENLNYFANNFGFTNEQLNQLHSITSKVMTSEQSISNAFNQMDQAIDNDSKRKALSNLIGATGGVGIPEGLHLGAKGQWEDSKGTSYSTQSLAQKVNDNMKKNGLSVQYSQAKNELKDSAVYQLLPTTQDKALLENTMNLIESNHARINDVRGSDLGELPFLKVSIPMQKGDQFQVGIINNLFDMAKAEKASAWQDFLVKESEKFGDKPPTQGQLEAAFARTSAIPDSPLSKINAKYDALIKEAQSRKYPETGVSSVVSPTIGGTSIEEKPKSPKARSIKEPPKKTNFGDEFLNSLKVK